MKKFLLITLSFFALCVVKAQRYQLDSIVSWSDQGYIERGFSMQSYDAMSNMLFFEQVALNESGIVSDGHAYRQEYDDHGNETLRTMYKWDSLQYCWEDVEQLKNTYESDNQLNGTAEYSLKHGVPDSGTLIQRSVKNGDTTYTTSIFDAGTSPIPVERSCEQYDTVNRHIGSLFERWSDEQQSWQSWLKTKRTYLRDTLLAENISYEWDGDDWVGNDSISINYLPGEDRIAHVVNYVGDGSGWVNAHSESITYSDTIRIHEGLAWSNHADAWLPYKHTTYHLDEEGREVDVIELEWNRQTDNYEKRSQNTTKYDDAGRVTLREGITYFDDIRVSGLQWQGEYDENGNLIRDSYANWDCDNESWKVYTVTLLAYDLGIVVQDQNGFLNILDKAELQIHDTKSSKNAVKSFQMLKNEDGQLIKKAEGQYHYSSVPK